ncbi:hypothetical protein CR513_15428, partial [Mucuna pruriens]
MGATMPNRASFRANLEESTLIPRLNNLLDELCGTCVFSKIELQSGYPACRKAMNGRLPLRPSLLVMPFVLMNAPSTFMRLKPHFEKSHWMMCGCLL